MRGEKLRAIRSGYFRRISAESKLLFASAFFIALFMLLSGVNAREQQTSATLLGTLTDSNGAVVTKAEIKVNNLATGASREAVSDESGNYSFPFLVAGNYEITITARGYKTKKI